MARIIYGVAGEGMGHTIRSEVVITHLMKKHKVIVVCGNRAYDYLSKRFKKVYKIESSNIIYVNNKVSDFRTCLLNIKKIPNFLDSVSFLFGLVRNFKPELVICDFEPLVDYVAWFKRIPVITIDNQKVITKTKIEFPIKFIPTALKSKIVIGCMIPNSKYNIIQNFFFPTKKKDDVFMFHPLLRKEIIQAKPKKGRHVLVYQTSDSCKELLPVLNSIEDNFVVYGFDKDKKKGNVRFKSFDEKSFFKDLNNCKAVIINGGLTLMTEALFLRKPILSVPVRSHFEQALNAIYLERFVCGEFHKRITKTGVEGFLKNLNIYEKNIKGKTKCGNIPLLKKLDELIRNLVS